MKRVEVNFAVSHQERSHLRILVSTKGAAIVKWSSRTKIRRNIYFENILSLKSQDTGHRYPKLGTIHKVRTMSWGREGFGKSVHSK